jgi:hypothetical protein
MSDERDDARRMLRELLPELLAEALGNANGHAGGNGNGNGNGSAPAPPAPAVPAPPVAAVLRPSTWDRAPEPGEQVGDAPAAAAVGAPAAPGTEWVTLESDADLDDFVRVLLKRFEHPRDRLAIRSGQVRFALRRAHGAAAGGATTLRVERGAVGERTVKQAAATGARLVLAPRAVLTPLAREQARALGVEIERERRC